RPVCCTSTRSPGSAPETNTVLPACACPSGLRATPRPSWLRSVISSSKGVWSMRAKSGLLLLPVAARVLVPPARTRALDPLLREHAAELRLPLGLAVGDRDLAVHGLAVAVVVGDGVVDRDPVLERELAGIADHDHAVVAEAERAGVEGRAQCGGEAGLHARLDR